MSRWQKTICLMGLLGVAGCGGSAVAPDFDISESVENPGSGSITLNLIVPPAPYASARSTLDSFEVTIEGEDMEVPFGKKLGAEAKGMLLENLPLGKGRSLTVRGLNANGELLRIGKIDSLKLDSTDGESVTLKLNAVPLVLNLRNGDHISNRRLFFRLFADPGERFSVRLNGAVLGERVADLRGIASFYHPDLPPGRHSFTILNLENDLTTQLDLSVWDGAKTLGAPFSAASEIRTVSSFGQPFTLLPKSSEALWRAE